MTLIKERIQAVINSKDRKNPLTEITSNFTWSFNKNINRVSEILIKSVQIPFSFYVINSTNNYFIINSTTITISNGNYTATSLILELINKINAGIGGNTVITYSSQTLKLTISNDNNIQIRAHNPGVTNSPLSKLLGFLVDSLSNTTIIADSAMNISGPNYISIDSQFLTRPIQNKTLYSDDNLQTSLLAVPVHTSFGDIITLEPNLPIRLNYKISINTSDIIDIKLLDEFGNIINLNGLDWAMQIIFITE
jgi:hypothetical protein